MVRASSYFGNISSIRLGFGKYAIAFMGTAIAYAAAAEIGLAIPFERGNLTPFWPAAAVSLSALLLFGPNLWPAILIADILVSLRHGYLLQTSASIAIGNAFEPLMGAYLLRRIGHLDPSLRRLRDVVGLVFLGAVGGPIAGAAFWVLLRRIARGIPIGVQFHAAFMWFRSDAVSILLLAPLLLVWSRRLPITFVPKRVAESAAALALLVGVDWLVFGAHGSFNVYAVEHMAVPCIIWLALRFDVRGATIAVFVTACIAIWHTVWGRGPFAREGLFGLHVFLAMVAVTALIIAATICEHRRTAATLRASEQELSDSEERYRDLFENAEDFIATLDLTGRFASANNAIVRVSGYSPAELRGMSFLDVVAPLSRESAAATFQEVMVGDRPTRQMQYEMVCKDGRTLWVEVNSRRLTHQGTVYGIQSIGRDVSWRKRLEQELLQSQKMEALGRLAGGVAHDFNNLLGVILGYSDLMLDELRGEEPLRKRVGEIRKAGQRAAEVTRQLLAFSRKQMLEQKVVDLSSIVSETTRMLLRLLGEDIELITKLCPVAAQVRTDPAQMQQVIINLALNARDAMPRGGKLILETSVVQLRREEGWSMFEELVHHGVIVVPGLYVVFSITDTGIGMDEQTKSRIFEPFFTTKPQGEGTGLGLATVYGFVKQSGGYIWAYSELAQGTTFKIYLRQVEGDAPRVSYDPALNLPHGSETILLVEDEHSLRELNCELLRSLGYSVLEAGNGAEALALAADHKEPIDLMLTDVVMPGMSGRELAERLVTIRPGMKFIYMSGYTDNVIVHHGILKSGIAFLQKPFSRDALASKLREVLESPRLADDEPSAE